MERIMKSSHPGLQEHLDHLQDSYDAPELPKKPEGKGWIWSEEKQKWVKYRIRKLTPRECLRLMDVRDSDIDKIQQAGISESQQYKLAGNSIVVNVMTLMFKNLLLENDEPMDTLF